MPTGRLRRSGMLAAAALLLAPTASPAAAAACQPARSAVDAVTLTPSGTFAATGAPHTVRATVTARTAGGKSEPVQGVCVSFEQDSGPSAGWPRTGTTAADGTVSVTYTSATAGTDVLFAQAYAESTTTSDRVTHRWSAAPSPASTPSPAPSPVASSGPSPVASSDPSPAPSPAPSPVASPAESPLPTPPPTGAPSPSSAGTALPTASSAPVASASAASPTPAPLPSGSGTGGFTAGLDQPSALPGGSARVSGRGCPAGAGVELSISGQQVGSATSDAAGAFAADLQLPRLAIGSHLVDVTCGTERTSLPIALVVSTSAPPAASRTVTAGAILLFFLLLTAMLMSRDQGEPVPIAEADDDDVQEDSGT